MNSKKQSMVYSNPTLFDNPVGNPGGNLKEKKTQCPPITAQYILSRSETCKKEAFGCYNFFAQKLGYATKGLGSNNLYWYQLAGYMASTLTPNDLESGVKYLLFSDKFLSDMILPNKDPEIQSTIQFISSHWLHFKNICFFSESDLFEYILDRQAKTPEPAMQPMIEALSKSRSYDQH